MTIETLTLSLMKNRNFTSIVLNAVKKAIDYVCDGFDFCDLDSVDKTYIGKKFETYLLRDLGLPYHIGSKIQDLVHDTRVAGIDLDVKFTLNNDWMIGPECVGSYTLVGKMNQATRTFSLGLIKLDPENLRKGVNRDKKNSISAAGKKNISWLIVDQPLPV